MSDIRQFTNDELMGFATGNYLQHMSGDDAKTTASHLAATITALRAEVDRLNVLLGGFAEANVALRAENEHLLEMQPYINADQPDTDAPVAYTRLEYLSEHWDSRALSFYEVGEYVTALRAENERLDKEVDRALEREEAWRPWLKRLADAEQRAEYAIEALDKADRKLIEVQALIDAVERCRTTTGMSYNLAHQDLYAAYDRLKGGE